MAASKTPHVRLLHIKGELDWMLRRFSRLSFEAFAADIVQLRAAERGLLIISEATKSLPEEMLASYPQIEWHAVRAIGNVLRHNYEQINPHRLWVILTVQLPALAPVIAELLEKHGPANSGEADSIGP
jgi:uncharacterized protein with HEPN domain